MPLAAYLIKYSTQKISFKLHIKPQYRKTNVSIYRYETTSVTKQNKLLNFAGDKRKTDYPGSLLQP